jgi:hypothetical protein
MAKDEVTGAASLDVGSVVANDEIAWIKNYPTRYDQWRGTNGSYCNDVVIDDYLARGASVLRNGYRLLAAVKEEPQR